MLEGREPFSAYRGSQAAIPVAVIITEKPRVSQAICRALLKDGEDPRLYGCTDSFRVTSSGRGEAASGPQRMYFEYGQTALQRLPLEVASLKQFKRDPAAGGPASDRREGRLARQGDVEKLTFYILEAAGTLVFVIDTNGNPLNLSFPGRVADELIGGIDAAALIARLQHRVRSERSERRQTSSEPDDDRSSAEPIARMELFTTILARERMPCDYRSSVRGTPIAIRRVIAATDDDVAGQAIFKSVIEYAEEERRRAGQEPIPTAALARLSSHGLTRAELIRAIGAETSYPEGMALAGKARSVFDYLYGQILRELSLDRRRRPPVGLGRVIWLGLEALIDEEDALQHNPKRGHLNLIFQGMPTGDDLKRRIASKDYMLVHCTARRTRISTSRFIELCRARHAGTHTTRFKLAERLSQKNLVTVDGPYVQSTSLGRAVLQAYKMFIDEPRIGLHPLDQDLRNTLETLSTASTTEEATPVFDAYLQRVIVALGEYVGWLRDHRERHDAVATVTDLRAGAAQRARRRRRERSSGADELKPAAPQHDAKTATVTLVGDDAMLAKEHVEAMQTNPHDFESVRRSEGPLSQDRTMTMRNLLRVPLDASFQAVDVFQPSLRERIDPSFCTVMRAPVELIDLHSVLDLNGALDCHVVSLALDDSPPSETTASAHEPLYVSDLRRPEINNPEKLRLIREYLAPWRINDALVAARSAGDPIPDTVLMRTARGSELRFERVDWVKKGRVHNFESMLAVMENKYMSPPARTEALMEDLYLS